MHRRDGRAGRTHDALLVRTLTVLLRVVLHAEVVAHLVGDRRGHQSDHFRMIGRHSAGEFVSAYRAFQSFSYYAVVEALSSVEIIK